MHYVLKIIDYKMLACLTAVRYQVSRQNIKNLNMNIQFIQSELNNCAKRLRFTIIFVIEIMLHSLMNKTAKHLMLDNKILQNIQTIKK